MQVVLARQHALHRLAEDVAQLALLQLVVEHLHSSSLLTLSVLRFTGTYTRTIRERSTPGYAAEHL